MKFNLYKISYCNTKIRQIYMNLSYCYLLLLQMLLIYKQKGFSSKNPRHFRAINLIPQLSKLKVTNVTVTSNNKTP